MLWHFVVSRAGLQVGLRMLLWSRDLKKKLLRGYLINERLVD